MVPQGGANDEVFLPGTGAELKWVWDPLVSQEGAPSCGDR